MSCEVVDESRSDEESGGNGIARSEKAAGSRNDRLNTLILLLMSPLMLYYLALVVASFVQVSIVDSEGHSYTVVLRATANFQTPLISLCFIDLCCMCPAHYWLTLYQTTRLAIWDGDGSSARHKKETTARAAECLTGWERTHFLLTLLPPFAAYMLVHGQHQNYLPLAILGVFLLGLLGAQQFCNALTRPRAAIVRFRGPETAAFAWRCTQACLVAAFLSATWVASCLGYWLIDQPYILPIDAPSTLDGIDTPAIVRGITFQDIGSGARCRGHPSGDSVEPWVSFVHDCDAQLFSGDYDLNSNATLPSLWTASGFRYFHFATWIVAHPLLALWPFQCYFGQGMFWTLKSLRPFAGVWEGLATLSFVLIALLWFMLIVGFNSTTNDASAGWWIFSTFIITDISIIFPLNLTILYKDSIVSTTRINARWQLRGQYAGFLSHYKAEAAADARQIKTGLTDQLGVPVFLDSDDLRDLRDLQGQLRNSDVLLFFQTKSVLTRPWCLIELYTAITEGVPIVPITVNGQFPYCFETSRKFLDNFESQIGGTWQGEELRKQGFDIGTMGRVLRESLPYIISSRIDSQASQACTNSMAATGQGQMWEPAASQEVLRAQVLQIIRAMEQAVTARGNGPTSLATTGLPQLGAGLDERTQLL